MEQSGIGVEKGVTPMSILVIDVGTSSIRGVLYDEKGTEIFCHQIPYQVHFIDGTHAEQWGARGGF